MIDLSISIVKGIPKQGVPFIIEERCIIAKVICTSPRFLSEWLSRTHGLVSDK